MICTLGEGNDSHASFEMGGRIFDRLRMFKNSINFKSAKFTEASLHELTRKLRFRFFLHFGEKARLIGNLTRLLVILNEEIERVSLRDYLISHGG